MQTATIEIPIEIEQEIKRIAPNKDLKKYILDLIFESFENARDFEIKSEIDEALKSGRVGTKKSLEVLNELKS